MKRIDWSVVLGIAGAFALLVLLFVFHPFSCVNSAKSSARVPPARVPPATGNSVRS